VRDKRRNLNFCYSFRKRKGGAVREGGGVYGPATVKTRCIRTLDTVKTFKLGWASYLKKNEGGGGVGKLVFGGGGVAWGGGGLPVHHSSKGGGGGGSHI